MRRHSNSQPMVNSTATPTTRRTVGRANQTLARAQATLRSAEANVTDSQAPLQRNANQALAELQRAAQALRVLADYLQRHPESLLRGKPPDALEAPK